MSPLFYEKGSRTMFAGRMCDQPFPMHLHEPVEIVCLTKGQVQMTVDGCTQTLEAGDLAVCFPVVPHSYDMVSADAQGLALIFTPETLQEFTHIFRTMRPVKAFVSAAAKDAELDVIARKLLEMEKDEPDMLRKAYMHVFLAHMMRRLPLRSAEQPMSETGLPYHVLHYISKHFTEPISLESTAHALGVSRIHLSHIFSQRLNINFRQYINTLRIDMACRLLRESKHSIARITDLCGYENPRTFHRAFQAQWNMTPTQFRAQCHETGQMPESKTEGV